MSLKTLFASIKDAATSSFDHVKTKLSGIFHDDVEPALITFLHVLETNGGAALVSLALQIVTAAASGTPFGVLTSTLIASAKDAGISVTEIAAKSALQVAKTHLEAQLADKEATISGASAASASGEGNGTAADAENVEKSNN